MAQIDVLRKKKSGTTTTKSGTTTTSTGTLANYPFTVAGKTSALANALRNHVGLTTNATSGGSDTTNSVDYRQLQLDALKKRLEAQLGIYNSALSDLDDQYQALINQSEVDRFKARNSLREALANRGQLDSGYGRQEALAASNNYANQTNNIRLQRQKARQDIQNSINSLKADYETDKANIYAS